MRLFSDIKPFMRSNKTAKIQFSENSAFSELQDYAII